MTVALLGRNETTEATDLKPFVGVVLHKWTTNLLYIHIVTIVYTCLYYIHQDSFFQSIRRCVNKKAEIHVYLCGDCYVLCQCLKQNQAERLRATGSPGRVISQKSTWVANGLPMGWKWGWWLWTSCCLEVAALKPPESKLQIAIVAMFSANFGWVLLGFCKHWCVKNDSLPVESTNGQQQKVAALLLIVLVSHKRKRHAEKCPHSEPSGVNQKLHLPSHDFHRY